MQEIQERGFDRWIRKIPWRREWQPTPVFSSIKYHRGLANPRGVWQAVKSWRGLAGYSPWGHRDSDITEHACT